MDQRKDYYVYYELNDLFACMVAAENHAKASLEAEEEQAWEESDDER